MGLAGSSESLTPIGEMSMSVGKPETEAVLSTGKTPVTEAGLPADGRPVAPMGELLLLKPRESLGYPGPTCTLLETLMLLAVG